MTTRALTLFAILGGTAGCCPDFDYQAGFQLDTSADLNAVVGLSDSVMIATADGQLIRASMDFELGELRQDAVEFSVDVPLNAVAAQDDWIWAVGDEGTFLQKPRDGDWELVDLGTDARLLDVWADERSYSDWLVVVGDGVVRVQSRETGEWFTPPEPDGGWGELRAVFSGHGLWAVGAAGVAWSAADPTQAWTAEDVGLGNVDLNGGGKRARSDPSIWVVGDAGSLAYLDESRWMVVDTGVREDLLDFANGLALARDGRLFIAFEGGMHRLDKARGLNRGLFNDGEDVVVVGEDGRGRAYRLYECHGW